MPSRALVTGAAGFIGSHLCDRLLAEGFEVIGVDNLCTGRRQNLAHLANEPRFTFIERDVIAPIELPDRIDGRLDGRLDCRLDWVLHFASPASPPKYHRLPVETMRVNGEGTYHLLELCLRRGARFFLASTSEVYGDPAVHPQPETYSGDVDPIGPRSVYDEAKRYAEALVSNYVTRHRLSARIVRIFNTYGPRMAPDDGRVVTNFIDQGLDGRPLTIYGDGSQTRSFQYIDDLVEGIWRLMAVEDPHPVNIGNPDERTMLELAEVIARLLGRRVERVHRPLPKDDPTRRRPDITRARALLGWQPRVTLEDGLARTIEHARAERLRAAHDGTEPDRAAPRPARRHEARIPA